MAKKFDPYSLASPPKPTFPVEIVSPSSSGLGGGFGSFGGGVDFRSMFMKFMKEAGEALGRAAAEEIEKARVQIESGEHRGRGEPLSGKNEQKQNRGAGMMLRNFMAGAGMRVPAIGALGAAGLAGAAAGFIINTPNRAGEHADSQRRFASVSPSMASAFAENDFHGKLRDLTSGEKLAPSNRELLRELNKFRDNAAQWGDAITEIKNTLETEILGAINAVVGPITEAVFGKRQNATHLPWEQRMIEMADKANHDTNVRVWREVRDRMPPKPAGAKE